jgi:glutaredoxin-like protein NrdH
MPLENVPGRNAGNLVLYALSTCPWCKKTKQLLKDLGVKFSFTDVDLLPEAEKKQTVEIIRKWTPAGSFPTLVIDDRKCIVGFKEDEIREALQK